MQFQLQHEFEWRGEPAALLRLLYTDPGLNEALAAMPHLARREVMHLDMNPATGRGERRVRIEVDMPVPRPLARLLSRTGAPMGWEEHSVCDLHAGTIDFAIHMPRLAAGISARGRYRLTAVDKARVLRHIAGNVHVNAPAVGRLAERVVVSRLTENMGAEADLTANYLRRVAN